MSSISSISSLISQYLRVSGESLSGNITRLLENDPDSGITDTVSLSSESRNLLKSLLSAIGNGSSGSENTLASLLASLGEASAATTYSGSSMYDVLMTAANTRLIKSNSDLVEMILAVDEAESSGDTSPSTGSVTSAAEDVNLMAMSANDLVSIIKKFRALSSPISSASSSQVDETV